jgi:2-C-methyl-D-erythritol 4-phosphate cytidylyltransferase/2-C-methyl-D-erythritol 2,4-cyclodiphosphate synthase
VVLVHDAARPFVQPDLIARVATQALAHGAAIAALRARDTVKRGVPSGDVVTVSETIPRETVHLAQTPQGFSRRVLAEAVALGRAGREATDEAALAEAAGHAVVLVEGDPHNIKVTTPDDLPVADAIARQVDDTKRRAPMPSHDEETTPAPPGRTTFPFRIGIGYDSHRFEAGRPLILGGVRVPGDRGLTGHSDADAVCHAVTDAVLGGACLGDIGKLFPDNDPRWKDADSIAMLEGAMCRVRDAGYRVGNVDLVVICERPKIGPYVLAMRERLASVLGVPPDAIGIKGKTNEGVDATGRGEALAVHAVALLVRDEAVRAE